MIALICGDKGSGKTKKLIEMANNDIKSSKGDIVFIDANKSKIYDLKYEIRLINAMEFNIDNIDKFHGFLCGIVGNNFDIEKIYIDGLYKLIQPEELATDTFLSLIETLSNNYDISFIMSASSNEDNLPEHLKKYIIQWK